MAEDIVKMLRQHAGLHAEDMGRKKWLDDAADLIERQAETIGNLCLSIAHAAEDIKDRDEESALAILNVALKSQGCETV